MALTSEKAREVMAEIKANFALLDGCEGPHQFTETVKTPLLYMSKMKCSKCGGVLNALDARWYEKGLAHGRKEMK